MLLAASRSDGNTAALAPAAFAVGSASLVDLSQFNVGYFSHSRTNAGDDFLHLVKHLLGAPIWMPATPVNWYTISAMQKRSSIA